MKTNLIALTVITTGIFLTSCDKDEVPTPVTVQTKTVSNLQADTIIGIGSTGQPYGSGKYTLYSLETNTVIANTDSATSKWDVGFRGTTIITNSGNSGPAAGGAFIYTGTLVTWHKYRLTQLSVLIMHQLHMLLKPVAAMAGIVIMVLPILLHRPPAAFW